MFNRINLRLPRFTFRTFLFSLFGFVILVLVIEGGYFFYLAQVGESKREQPTDSVKPSSILGKELAVTPNKNYQNLEASAGVREHSDGTIGIAGHFSGLTSDSLILEVKGKEVTVAVDSKTAWVKTNIEGLRMEEREKAPVERISPDSIEKGDWIDVLCEQSKDGLTAMVIFVVYH